METLPLVKVFDLGAKDAMSKVGIHRQFPLIPKQALAVLQDYTFDQITGLSEDLRKMVKSQIRLGIIQGEGVPEIAKRLINEGLPKGSFEKVNERARVIARTELAGMYTEGSKNYYKQAGVKRVRVIGKGINCHLCGPHIGQEYDVDQVPRIPLHPNCQCGIEPVIE